MRTNTGGMWFGVSALALTCLAGTTMAQAPADNCASAPTINGAGSYAGTTVGATIDGTASCGSAAADVWFRLVAPAPGQYRFDTCNPATNFDTTIAIRTGCGGAGSQLACNDDAVSTFCPANATSSRAVVSLSANQVVFVRVSSALPNVTGNFVLNVTTPPPPPPPPPVTLGPDVTVNQITDIARWGTGTSNDGVAVTAFSVGTDSCNPGDYPVLWIDAGNYAPDYNDTQHPVINQNMYRLKSYGNYARFEQLGQSWLKHGFLSTNSNACGSCQASNVYFPSLGTVQNIGSDALGVNCSDTYGAGLNGSQGNMGAKNIVNATLGTSPFVRGNGTQGTVGMRLQVPTVDVTNQPAGARYFFDGYYVTADDAQWVRPNETVAFNAMNNASWREITAATVGANAPTFAGNTHQREPGIFAWKSVDPSVTLITADHDDTPHPVQAGKFIRSRFWVAAKATDLGGGLFRYEYAVYNHNSDRSAQQFIIPLPDAAPATDVSFRAPRWHSGEPYSNNAWTMVKANNKITFQSDTFAANPNANALRWGELFNFGFTTTVAPTTGNADITLFKPGFGATPLAGIPAVGLPVPTVPPACLADFNGDNAVNPDDLADYISCYFSNPPCSRADFNASGTVDPDDISDFVTTYFTGC